MTELRWDSDPAPQSDRHPPQSNASGAVGASSLGHLPPAFLGCQPTSQMEKGRDRGRGLLGVLTLPPSPIASR